MSKKTLPTLLELHQNVDVAFKNDSLNALVNKPPRKEWIKEHPLFKKEIIDERGYKIKVPVEYIPVDKVEMMLTMIFQQWKLEVIRYNQLFNSVAVQVRLHYLNPTNGEWMFQDGLGAVGIQTDKGADAADLSAIKSNAVMMALPAAESYALKDAAEKIGILFGSNLNRKDTMAFSSAYEKKENPEHKRVREYVEGETNAGTLTDYENDLTEKGVKPEIIKIVSDRINEILESL